MAQCFDLVGDTLQLSAQTVENCTGFVLVNSTEYVSFYNSVGLNPQDVAAAFAWGFGAVFTTWAAQYPIKVAKQVIHKF